MNISIRGLEKAAVLAALYNAAQPQGAGFMQYDPKPMTTDEAAAVLARLAKGGDLYFDYVKGRVMKVDLSKDDFDPRLYDRDNGQGAAQKVIDTLKASNDVNNPVIAGTHNANAKVQAMHTRAQLGDRTTLDENVVTIGLDDLAPELEPRVDKVING
jgi:hypothetical protein